ncbi:MAG TPA: TIGR00159 family protein [Candidatus Avoscillospira stercoripullorum]|uniref:Diadenylate cyclase n=1 Tax=Candidatus Avoscillospira stercoripullorum TaxID=2840709 RepID=A0A9D1D6H7_9FIRM|nr:TIGR00159 family protein [Candidatus Avoscillospira stercoripullorum]
MAFLIYKVVNMVHSTSTARVAKAIVALLLATWITGVLQMEMLHFGLNKILELGVIALVIMFQPELRRALERFGGKSVRELLSGKSPRGEMEEAILATVSACEIMSKERVGVLLIFERETSLEEYFKTGTILDARTSEQLLRNLFFPKASLHDGAVIIRGGRVIAAGCVMPLSENPHLSSDLGTRHRAGVGTSEVSDAVVVIVSEETGTISVAIGGMLKRHLAPQTLERLLTSELVPNEEEQKTLMKRVKQFWTKKGRSNAK